MTSKHTARLLLGTMLAVNGIAMLAVPHTWYALMPGVPATGPLNLHFVRDIGSAYLVAGVAFFWLCRDARAWPAALAGSAFLALHGMIHLAEAAAGMLDLHHLARDAPGVLLLPLAALWLALPRSTRKENHDATMDCTAPARRL